MSTAIIVAVLIVIAVIAIRSYAKKLTSGVAALKSNTLRKLRLRIKMCHIIRTVFR